MTQAVAARPVTALRAAVRDRPWTFAFATAGVLVAALHLIGLGDTPPGLYADEASIGYNAWAIAHHGVDEHGASFPLYFEAFGEYKNPLYIYLLAPFTWVLPLTAATVRLPAALCGLTTCVLLALTVHRFTRSRAAALATLLVAGVTPWLVLESRLGFEVMTLVTCLAAALWCLAHSVEEGSHVGWRWGTGVSLGLAVFAYSVGRLLVAALILGMVVVDHRWRRLRILPVLLPVVAAYLIVGIYAATHGDNLNRHFAALSITADGASLPVVAARFVRNDATYYGVPFLFTNGDAYLRHSTGWGGMLLVTSLPALLAGLARCLRQWREPLPRLLLVGLLVGPVPAALTAEDTPHALRSIGLLPFLLVVTGIGWCTLLPWLRGRVLLAAVLALAVCVDAGGYSWDLFTYYPGRAVLAFDTGELDAVQRAHELADGGTVLLSDSLDNAYVQAIFALRPDPNAFAQHGLSVLGMRNAKPSAIAGDAQPGDILVLAPRDPVPVGATLLFSETVTVSPDHVVVGNDERPRVIDLVDVYRR